LTLPAFEPFFVSDGDTFVPNDIAHGGWGPTLGGQVVGGLLARAVEQQRADPELNPARFTVDILRRVATAPVQVHADVVRTGRRMQAIDAMLTQGGELVARASTLLLRRGDQPHETPWTTTISMPPIPQEPAQFDGSVPMFITPYGGDASDYTFPWQHDGPRCAWVREIRPLVDDESLTPFVRAAMAVDVTASLTGFSKAGLEFINADYTLTLCRLPTGPYIGLGGLTHYSADGIAVGSASLFDAHGPIGSSLTTAAANSNFRRSVGVRGDGSPDQSSADE
jgi:acyl-coenzyme A thioesterase PaaI-like protein